METLELHRDEGVARLLLARSDKPVNILDETCMGELEAALDELERTPPRLLVVESALPGCFVAGADIDAIEAVTDADLATRLAERGQSLMRRIEDLPCASVAVVSGACMGGGLELALACDYILAVQTDKTRLALPEIKIGIHPGFGGCVRLPRKIGWAKASDMILTGRSVDARRARRLKIADLVCHPEQVESGIRLLAARGKRAYSGKQPWWMRLGPARVVLFSMLRNKAMKRFRHLDIDASYPAVPAVIKVLGEVARSPEGQAYAMEAASLGRLAVTPSCKNLIRVFHLGQALHKQQAVKQGRERAAGITHSAVFGAGVMGSGIAWVAAKSGAVDLHEVNDKALAHGMQGLSRLARRDTTRIKRIRPVRDASGLSQCKLVIEAVVEEMHVKNALWSRVAGQVGKDTLLVSNTSSLSVSRMQRSVPSPGRMAGMHFFNPAPKMPLVEIIAGSRTTQKTVQTLAALAASWGKYPVIVADRPGFLVNRCLMPYVAAAFALTGADRGQKLTHVDGALKQFGMPMGAFELADRVGLDICRHVGEHLSAELGTRSGGYKGALPEWFSAMVDDGLLGEKSGAGFFTWEKGRKGAVNPGLADYLPGALPAEKEGKANVSDAPPPMNDTEVVDDCLLPMLVEALACLDEGVVASPEELDAAMVFGIGFPPFRGGLLHYYAAHEQADLAARIERRGLSLPANLDVLQRTGK